MKIGKVQPPGKPMPKHDSTGIGRNERSTEAQPVTPKAAQQPQAAGPVSFQTSPSSRLSFVDVAVLYDQVQDSLKQYAQPGESRGDAVSGPLKTVLTNLHHYLKPALLTGDPEKLAARIRDFIENGGFFFEKRLEKSILKLNDRSFALTPHGIATHPAVGKVIQNDLKSNLLVLNQLLSVRSKTGEDVDRSLQSVLRSVVQKSLSHIEQQQQTAAEKPADPDTFQPFSHLIALQGRLREARLNVYYARKGGEGGQKTPRVALLLEMGRLGKVRTDLWMVSNSLNVTFFVENEEAKTIIEDARTQIEPTLNKVFETAFMNVVVNEKKIERFDATDAAPREGKQVDINI